MFENRKSAAVFFLIMIVIALLNVNYSILRSARNALAVVDLGGGAGAIPLYELLGTMPGAVLMTLGLTWLLNRYSISKVFYITISLFCCFFVFFVVGVYPYLLYWREVLSTFSFIPNWVVILLPQFFSMLFFTMAELWKVALLTVLFWGFINQTISLENAKRFYAPLMLGGSLGSVLASPIISFCTSDKLSNKSWNESLLLIVFVLIIISGLTVCFFYFLSKQFAEPKKNVILRRTEASVWETFRTCFQSRYLRLLALVTIADYVAFAIGEVIFLDVLKVKYPDPREYCDFMGKLSLIVGFLTAFSALVVTPFLLKRCNLVVIALVTPLCFLLTESIFFFVILHPGFSNQIGIVIFFGGLFFCVVRAVKFTVFDTWKELAFMLLPPEEKMNGKLIVDGIGTRLGRGGGALATLSLLQLYGGILASAPLAGVLVLVVLLTCLVANVKLGWLMEQISESQQV